MNTAEGINRFATVIRWIGHAGVALTAAFTIVALLNNPTSFSDLGIMAALGGILCALIYAAAWVIAGFARPKA